MGQVLRDLGVIDDEMAETLGKTLTPDRQQLGRHADRPGAPSAELGF